MVIARCLEEACKCKDWKYACCWRQCGGAGAGVVMATLLLVPLLAPTMAMPLAPKLSRCLDIYNIYFLKIGQGVTIRSCIPSIEEQLQKKLNFFIESFGR